MDHRVTVCILRYGNYPELARQVIHSIVSNCDKRSYKLIVGGNACCRETLDFINTVAHIDQILISDENLNVQTDLEFCDTPESQSRNGENPRSISQAGLRGLIQSLLEDADADRTALAFETELRRRKHDTCTRTKSKCRR